MPACSDARFGFSTAWPLAFAFGRRFGRFAELHVGAVAAVHHVDVLAGGRIDAERARPFGLGAHQLQRLLDRQIRRRHVFGQRRRPAGAAFADLDERTEPADADANRSRRSRRRRRGRAADSRPSRRPARPPAAARGASCRRSRTACRNAIDSRSPREISSRSSSISAVKSVSTKSPKWSRSSFVTANAVKLGTSALPCRNT